MSSEALIFEVERNPILARKEYALEVLSRVKLFIAVNAQLENRARELAEEGIEPLDALHLASAEQGLADYFCTCDNKLLKKAKAIKSLKMKTVSPIELIEEIEK